MSETRGGALWPPRATRVPASLAQRQLWLHAQGAPDVPLYNEPMTVHHKGLLNRAALEEALNEVLRRHEAWRTTFISDGDDLFQVIHPLVPVRLPVVDLGRIPPEEREAEALRLATEDARRPFDLERGPLLRATLVEFDDEHQRLYLTLHHMIFDGVSVYRVFLTELAALYEAFAVGRPSPLGEPPVQYVDFALHQRAWMNHAAAARQLAYWRRQLSQLPPPLALPTDKPRSARPTFRGAVQPVILPRPLVAALRALGHREGVTLYMTLLAGLSTLLHRYTGEHDLVVGTLTAGRKRPEHEHLLGYFVNPLALRLDLHGDPPFRELLRRIRDVTLDALTNDDVPFEDVVKTVRQVREPGRHPLFQVLFFLEPPPGESPTGWNLTHVEVDTGTAKFDLHIELQERAEGLAGRLTYRTDLFEPATIVRFIRHLQSVLEAAVADAGQRLSALSWLPATERRRLLFEWNDTQTLYPAEATIHATFEAQVDLAPEAVALVDGARELTYRELDRRANRLAGRLRELGVGPDVLVAICIERSLELIVAMLAVLKADAAYLPLDPAYPPDALALMLEDSGAVALLTQRAHLAQLSSSRPATILLEAGDPMPTVGGGDRFQGKTTSHHLAYVIYTSGSTGRPKGVAVPHQAVLRLLMSQQYARLGPDETLLQLASSSFDASVFEIWGALLHGGRCVLFPGRVPTPGELAEVIRAQGVTTLWLTASLFNSIIDLSPQALRGVRQLLTGGEALSVSHVRRAFAHLPGTTLINGYGPTETTVFACTDHIPGPPDEEATSVPIGRPIANTTVYILDRHLAPVPIGVTGELCIGGPGLARGYLNRPELTAERFVPNPFGLPGDRLYRTGDLARYLPDGRIECLGRLDSQVKIRGFRVEPGEIEVVLSGHPTVREVAVVAAGQTSDRSLVAYVVPREATSPTTAELRRYLTERLPAHMIPSAFVVVESLPLTPNGKLDRQRLPAPPTDRSEPDGHHVAPRNPLEFELVRLWEDLLGVTSVGVTDDFFELGGHSLLAVRLFMRLEEKLRMILPLATLFEARTVEALAAVIRTRSHSAYPRSIVAIQPFGSRSPAFAIPGVGGSVLGYEALARLLGPDQPFYGLQSRGLDGSEQPLTRIEDIASTFLREVREVQADGPYYLVGACMGGTVAFEMAQQLRAAGQEVGLLALLDAWRPPSASTRRLWRDARTPAVVEFIAGRLRLYLKTLARLRRPDLLHYLLGRLKVLTDVVVQPDRLRGVRYELYLQAVARANLLAFQKYEPRVYPGPVVLFCAEGRKVATGADLSIAWRDLITGELEVYSTLGDDSGLMLTEPHVRVVAAQLRLCIERVKPSAVHPGLV